MLVRRSLTPTLDTLAYGAGDTVFDRTELLGAVNSASGKSRLVGVTVHDKDDQGAALTLFFLRANVAFGTANAAPSISDANADNIVSFLAVAAADYQDLGGVRVAFVAPTSPIPIEAVDKQQGVYVAATTSGTPTYTASGLVFDFWFELY